MEASWIDRAVPEDGKLPPDLAAARQRDKRQIAKLKAAARRGAKPRSAPKAVVPKPKLRQ